MTREEQIINASQLYAKHQQKPFMDGASWADRTMLNKACEWLKKSTILANTTIDRFRKAMEE